MPPAFIVGHSPAARLISWRLGKFGRQVHHSSAFDIELAEEVLIVRKSDHSGESPMKPTVPEVPRPPAARSLIPSTLQSPDAVRFRLAVLFTGVGTGIGAAALTRLLEVIQRFVWSGSATNILDAAHP